MSNNNIRKSLIASALAGAFMFSGVAAATTLADVTNAGIQNAKASVKSQEKINNLYDQSQELLNEYRSLLEQTENLKVYNDHVNTLVNDQNATLTSLEKQIGTIEQTKQGIVPLMYKMVDMLEAFIKADVPVELERRLATVQRLREYLGNASINTSEQFRVVVDAYVAEKDRGTAIATYTDKLNLNGTETTVNFVYIGRVALLAMSLDEKQAWMWNKKTSQWEELGAEFIDSTKLAIRVAAKQSPPQLIKLPVFAAE